MAHLRLIVGGLGCASWSVFRDGARCVWIEQSHSYFLSEIFRRILPMRGSISLVGGLRYKAEIKRGMGAHKHKNLYYPSGTRKWDGLLSTSCASISGPNSSSRIFYTFFHTALSLVQFFSRQKFLYIFRSSPSAQFGISSLLFYTLSYPESFISTYPIINRKKLDPLFIFNENKFH